MNSQELGKRIKEARIARKMTQSELVGDFITRNMLSRIESGNACPSVKTLEYLANRLELPPGSLMDNISDDIPVSESKDSELLLICKKHFKEKAYSDAAESAKQLIDSDFSDEGAAILAKCFMNMAKSAADAENYPQAVKYAKSAMEFSDDGIYKSREISMEAMLLLKELADKN
ncbi:MAG: helix-turn-helix transcriptional regulator [Ruminiclostridium sp.]|nr:helix-turn-helix transcriptional regulator [Ruminiclostridium sp.]